MGIAGGEGRNTGRSVYINVTGGKKKTDQELILLKYRRSLKCTLSEEYKVNTRTLNFASVCPSGGTLKRSHVELYKGLSHVER